MLLTAISANIELSAKIKAELILFHNSKTMMTSKLMVLTENLVSFEQQTEEMTQDTGFWNKLTKVAESSKEAATHLTTQTTDKLGNAAKSSMEVLANTASKTGEAIGQATTNTVHFASEAGHIVTNIAGDALSGAAKGTSVVAFWTLSQLAEGLMDGVKSSFASGFGLPAFCLLLGLIFIYRFVFKRSSKKVVYSYLGQSDTSSVINDSSLIETPENDVTR